MLLCQHLHQLSTPTKNNKKLLSITDIQYDNISDDNLFWIADLDTLNCVGEKLERNDQFFNIMNDDNFVQNQIIDAALKC